MFLRIKTNVFSDIQIPIHGSFARPKLVSERIVDFEVQDYDRESTRSVEIVNKGDFPVQIHAQSLDQYAANIGYRVYESVTLEAHNKARAHLVKLVENIVKSRPELKLELNVKNPDNATEVLDSLVAKCEKSPCEKTPQFFAVSYDTKHKKTTGWWEKQKKVYHFEKVRIKPPLNSNILGFRKYRNSVLQNTHSM